MSTSSPQVMDFVILESYPGRPPAMDLAAVPGSGTPTTQAGRRSVVKSACEQPSRPSRHARLHSKRRIGAGRPVNGVTA